MEINPNPNTGQEVIIQTIDGMRIEAEVIDDSDIEHMVIKAKNLAIKGEFKLERKEIYLVEPKGKELRPPDIAKETDVSRKRQRK